MRSRHYHENIININSIQSCELSDSDKKHIKKLQDKAKKKLIKKAYENDILFNQTKMSVMGSLLNNISHQWRQPLNAIALLTQNLVLIKELKQELDPSLLEQTVNDVNKQIQDLSRTIEDFDTFFNSNIIVNNFCINESINKVLALLDISILEAKINLSFKANEFQITSKENSIILILLNLLKYIIRRLSFLKDSPRVLQINLEKRKNSFDISLISNINHFSKKKKKKVFNPCYCLKDKSITSGFELYIANQICKNELNGKIKIKNTKQTLDNEIYACTNFLLKIPI